jgi:hypothetical protein
MLKGILKEPLMVAVTLMATFAAAQDTTCTSLRTMLTVPGKEMQSFVTRLTSTDIHVKLGNQEIKDVSIKSVSTPLKIAIVVDIGSSHNKSTWTLTEEALRRLMATFPAGTKVSLVMFDDRISQELPLTSQQEAINRTLMAIEPSKGKESGKTTDEAIAAGVSSLETADLGDAEVLVTARDRGEPEKYRAAQQALADAGVRLFVISFDHSKLPGGFPVPIFISLNRPTPLGALARLSGGIGIVAANGAEAEGLAKATVGAIRDVYDLTAQLTRAIDNPKPLKIDVKGHATVFYPAFSPPCR